MAQSNKSRVAPRAVAVARFSAIGDVAMTVPALYDACLSYPGVRFVMVTKPAMAKIFVDKPQNLTVLGVDVKGRYKGPMGMRRLVKELREEHGVDCFVDLHDVIRTRLMGLFFRLGGIPVARIDKGRREKKALISRRGNPLEPLAPQIVRYKAAFAQAGLPAAEHFAGLFGGRGKADPALFAAISGPKPAGRKWIGIAPFAAHSGKIYPVEMMEQVVDRLAQEPEVVIFLLGGGEEERRVLDGWARGRDNVHNLAGKKAGFTAELALLNHMDAVLTMDSGNMHLAAIAGAPTVSIWGATHPYCGFQGWRQGEADMLQLPMECRPCSVFGDKPCHRGDYLCLRGIQPTTVYKKVMEKINE